jgi:hypothetical protein
MASLHGDLQVPVSVDTRSLDWSPSPSGTVWRKRVHLVGPPEAGQITSVVRYQEGATFPAHDHPQGEEILVLEGVFSDEHGNWPRGTYLLNPEGFRHAPFSRDGCELFVKLRQFPGTGRRHVAVQTGQLDWSPPDVAGVQSKPLYAQAGFVDTMRLERWPAGLSGLSRDCASGVELFVIDGRFEDALGSHETGSWVRLPPGSRQFVRSDIGCTVYIKEGGFTYLHGAA